MTREDAEKSFDTLGRESDSELAGRIIDPLWSVVVLRSPSRTWSVTGEKDAWVYLGIPVKIVLPLQPNHG